MKVRAKKSLGQHFLTDLNVARRIADALVVGGGVGVDGGSDSMDCGFDAGGQESADAAETVSDGGKVSKRADVIEVGPGTGVLTQFLLRRDDINLKMVELDSEAVNYLLTTFSGLGGKLIEGDFLRLRLDAVFPGDFHIIGNFPYNISSQIFFKVLDYRDRVPQVVCMIQREVAERIAEKPGSKTYGILSVLLQAWYDIEYLFSVGPGAFNPPPKVNSAVIRLRRNSRTSLGCDEALFKTVVKTAFNQRRKTLRNSLRPLILAKAARDLAASAVPHTAPAPHAMESPAELSADVPAAPLARAAGSPALAEAAARLSSDAVFDLRPERLSVEDFIALTLQLS